MARISGTLIVQYRPFRLSGQRRVSRCCSICGKVDRLQKKECRTVGNWKQEGREIEHHGEFYYWSKDREFLKFIDLPKRINQPLELAMDLADPTTIRHGPGEVVRALGVSGETRQTLQSNGWKLADTHALTTDPWPYRDYVRASRGEFTVARDLHVRLRSSWSVSAAPAISPPGGPSLHKIPVLAPSYLPARAYSHLIHGRYRCGD